MFTVLDLFSGKGEFAEATKLAGGRTLAFCERDQKHARVLKKEYPEIPNYRQVTKLCRRLYDCEEIDLEAGTAWCPRCNSEFGDCACIGTDQFTDTHGVPHVVAGKVPFRIGDVFGREAWGETLRIIRELRPPFAIFETSGLLLQKGYGIPVFPKFAGLGYDVQWDFLPSHRKSRRLWIIAISHNLPARRILPRDAAPVPPPAYGRHESVTLAWLRTVAAHY